jgi:hypothetical protein
MRNRTLFVFVGLLCSLSWASNPSQPELSVRFPWLYDTHIAEKVTGKSVVPSAQMFVIDTQLALLTGQWGAADTVTIMRVTPDALKRVSVATINIGPKGEVTIQLWNDPDRLDSVKIREVHPQADETITLIGTTWKFAGAVQNSGKIEIPKPFACPRKPLKQ